MAKKVEQVTTVEVTEPSKAKDLYVSVTTFKGDTGKPEFTRVVNLYHFGTRQWLQNHQWWAIHNGYSVNVAIATPDEVATYLDTAKANLAAKFAK